MSEKRRSHPVDLSEVFAQLSDPIRRRILVKLLQANPRGGDEFQSNDVAEEGDDLDLLRSDLYHTHLPKLGEAGFIDWDEETDTFTRGARFDEIAPLLQLMADHEDELPDDWP